MNGNITREGITADLEAMKRVGIGGAQIFNVDCGIPAGPIKVLSPEWRELVVHAAKEADRLGLELCLHNCAGWSSSGGPWNTPAHAMQRVTTSERTVSGPTHFSEVLRRPPARLDYYRDIAVLAFPAPEGRTLRIQNFEAKSGANGDSVMSSPASKQAAPGQAVQRGQIVDLSSRLQADGRLEWDVPAGNWTILRLGYTPTGKDNHPAPREATGPECDKFSREALEAHWKGFVQKVLDDLGPLAGKGKALDNVLIDSYEVGGQNWTSQFRAEFQKRRSYDPLLYLPTLTGRVVENPEVSERFLWDMRRTIADLFAENYYGYFQELCHRHGLMSSIEPYTGPFESLQSGEAADIPIGEFWVGSQPDSSVKLAASVGHIYGRPVIGAESFTAAPSARHGRWLDDPYALKTLGDLVFCQGVNRYIFHRYAMQPWTNRWPGMTMGQWGTHFDRTSTWFEQGRAWLKYVARCQYLLQQGRFVADAAYFCGESAPVTMRVGDPALPPGYDWDAVDAGVLLRHATVEDGCLVLDSGMRYHVLILPPSDRSMRPTLLRKLAQFVEEGLTLVGAPPQASPSLEGYPECDARVKQLANKIWGDCDGRSITQHKLGKGKAVWGQSMADVLAALALKPDFEYAPGEGSRLASIHRRDGEADLYFVSNQRKAFDTVECTFRVADKAPELWDLETGRTELAPVWHEEAGRTVVRLPFDPAGSMFIVFRAKPEGDHLVAVQREGPLPVKERSKPAELRILKAVYGVFPTGTGTGRMDVTAQVKSSVASGTIEIPASNDFAGDDPAPNVVKRMRVEMRVNGQKQTIEAGENAVLKIPPGAEIIQAVYGKLSEQKQGAGEPTVDLTRKLSGLVRDGELSVRADNDLAGRDPAYLTPKELRVDYSLDGVVKHVTVQENEMLTLPDTGEPAGTQPSFTFAAGADAKPRLMTWAPGKFSMTWSSGRKAEAQCGSVPSPVSITGPWEVSFPPGWKAREKTTFEMLQSWTENSDAGIKYFSGTATYSKQIELPPDWINSNREVWLDLGRVKNLAEVTLNGKPLGILWKPPFHVNVTAAARPGKNTLEVKITNLWPNRLIGDEQLPPDCKWAGKQLKEWPQWLLEGKPSPTGRLTFTTWHHWTKDEAPLESGLLGPVTLRCTQEVSVP